MDYREARTWGMIYKTLDEALKATNGAGLNNAEMSQMSLRPQYYFGEVMRRAMASHAIDDRSNAILSMLFDGVEARSVDGTAELSHERQGDMMNGYIAMNPARYFIGAQEAADMLGITRSRVTQLCSSGQLRSARGADGLYITRESVMQRMSDEPSPGRPRNDDARRPGGDGSTR